MIRKRGFLSRKILLILLIILAAIVAGFWLSKDKGSTGKVTYPEYMNFDGNYVFSVPKDYSVDEHSLAGVVFIYKGQIVAKTAEDVINGGGISVESIKDLNDHSSKAFKNYVNSQFVPQVKKNLSTNNVKVKFIKQNGTDAADITIDNGSKPYRYIKGGQHPAVIVAKQENSDVKSIEQTFIDLEKSDLKDQVNNIKSTITSTAQQVRNQNGHDLYASGNDEFKSKTTEDQLTGVLKTAAPYTDGNMTISGFSYTPTDFAARMKMVKLDKNDQQPVFGDMNFKITNGQWKLQAISLPTPKQ